MISETFNIDNIIYMKDIPDKFFDLVMADPPYGIDVDNRKDHGKKRSVKSAAAYKDYDNKGWDKDYPDLVYFNELFRISKNQIIWGVNYYPYQFLVGGRIFWDKDTAKGFTSGDGELAYCSMTDTIRKFKYTWNGMIQQDMKNKEVRCHPTQKPIALYKWLIKNYAKEGDKIFDPNLGSQSSRIAAYDMGFDFWGCEIDADYFREGNERFEKYKLQGKLFIPEQIKPTQNNLL